MALDQLDRRILRLLQKSGRMSNLDLSEQVGLSASACHRRVQQLEKNGYINQYVALLNPRKIGVPTTVFVEITLRGQTDEVLEDFEKAVALIPEDLARIHRQYLARLPGVAQMQSSFALRTVFKTTSLPLGFD